MEYKWANFISGGFGCPVIRINNASELKMLQSLAEKNKLTYYETFISRGYREILHILEINSNYTDFYRNSRGGKSFLVEYSFYKGFTFALLNQYDNRQSEDEWKVIPMQEIIDELLERKS